MKRWDIKWLVILLILPGFISNFYADNRYNEDMNLPQATGGKGDVAVQTGVLKQTAADLSLPGLNDLDFEVKRTYSSVTANIYNMALTQNGLSIVTRHTPVDWKYGLGSGWTFSWPFIMKDIDDNSPTKKLNLFWDGAVYELAKSFSSSVDENNIQYYYVNDKRVYLDSSVTYTDEMDDPLLGTLNNKDVSSKYCLELKNGTKYYFSASGNLMVIKKPVDNGAGQVNDTQIWFYYQSHTSLDNVDDYEANRKNMKIEIVKDSAGRVIDFVYKTGAENWLVSINYNVILNGTVTPRSISYHHQNLSEFDLNSIHETTGNLDLLSNTIEETENKFCLDGFINQIGHLTQYQYQIYQAPFSFNSSTGSANNYFLNLMSLSENYSNEDGEELFKNQHHYEYNQYNGGYQIYKKPFSNGYMSTFKVTREYAISNIREKMQETAYGYYGSSYGKSLNEYWTEKKTGGLLKKYVYGATNVVTEENLLLYVETTGNGGQFKEREDYVYDIRKTMKSKTLYRNGIEKYSETYIYDQYNDLTYHKDLLGLETSTEYDQKFHVPIHITKTNIKNGDGSITERENRNEIRQTDGKTLKEILYIHDPVSGIKKAIVVKKYQYDAYGNPISVTDARGHVTWTVYDPEYHLFPETVEKQVTIDGVLTSIKSFKKFNSDETVWIECDNEGYAVEHIYNAIGDEIKTILPDENDFRNINTVNDLLTTDWTDSRLDNTYIEKVIDYQKDSITEYGESYQGARLKKAKISDGLGNLLKEVLYDNEVSSTEYSTKVMEYDAFGNMIALTDPDADWDKKPRKKRVNGKWIDAYDKTWLVWYDDLNRKTRVVYPDEGLVSVDKRIVYNDQDYTVTTINTLGHKTVQYFDVAENLIKLVEKDVTDQNNKKSNIFYTFEYNAVKQKISFTDPAQEQVLYNYDERGLLVELDYGNGSDNMVYDHAGNIIAKTDRKGSLVQYEYDEMDRNIKQEYFNADDLDNPYDSRVLGYDRRGNLVHVKSNALEENRLFDSRKRIMELSYIYQDSTLRNILMENLDWVTESSIDKQEFTFEFHYVPNNLMDYMILPNGKRVEYSYDPDKLRLTGIEAELETQLTDIVTGFQYTPAGQIIQMDYSNGTAQKWQFDLRKRVKNILVQDSLQTTLVDLNYQIDPENNILSINDHQYQYDELSRIISADTLHIGKKDLRKKIMEAFGTSLLQPVVGNRTYNAEADLNNDQMIDGLDHIQASVSWRDQFDREKFSYDKSGNRTVLTQNGSKYIYTYGERNKLLNIQKDNQIILSFLYDNNGNMIKKTEYQDGQVLNDYDYLYDIQNRLIQVNLNGEQWTRYIYDNAGLRLYKEENNQKTFYFRNGQTVNLEVEIIKESEQVNKVVENSYIISGDLIASRITRESSGTDEIYYYHLDHLNSTKMVTNEAQEVVLNYEYRAFGTELDKIGTDTNRFSFIGREFDDEIDLYYINARYYDAGLGRFINVDPAKDGYNWYIYANNNPLKLKDPTGLFSENVEGGPVADIQPTPSVNKEVKNNLEIFKDKIGVSVINEFVSKNINLRAAVRPNDGDKIKTMKGNWNNLLDKVDAFKGSMNKIVKSMTDAVFKIKPQGGKPTLKAVSGGKNGAGLINNNKPKIDAASKAGKGLGGGAGMKK